MSLVDVTDRVFAQLPDDTTVAVIIRSRPRSTIASDFKGGCDEVSTPRGVLSVERQVIGVHDRYTTFSVRVAQL